MNLLEFHSKELKRIVKAHGVQVKLTTPDGLTEYPGIYALWNAVEHVLKVDNLNGDPMGSRSSIYIDRDSLQLESGEILPIDGWKVTGSPNIYDSEKDYYVEIPKKDFQLPGILLFLSEINPAKLEWNTRPE